MSRIVYYMMHVQKVVLNFLIMVLFPKVTPRKIVFTYCRVARSLLFLSIVFALFYRKSESIHKELLHRITQGKNKKKNSRKVTTKLNDTKNKSSELSINDASPHCITEIQNV